MKSQGAIHVTHVRNLEKDDLFAFETAGRLASGKIKGLYYSALDLDEEAREYMGRANLKIPDNENEPLGGPTQEFILFELKPFSGVYTEPKFDHIFLALDDMVVVFEYDRPRDFHEIKDCGE